MLVGEGDDGKEGIGDGVQVVRGRRSGWMKDLLEMSERGRKRMKVGFQERML